MKECEQASRDMTFGPPDFEFRDPDFIFDDDHLIPNTSSPPYIMSKRQAHSYYAGLPSRPKLVYRSGAVPWKRPMGPEAYTVRKELKPVFDHKIVAVWKVAGPKIIACLDEARVLWTSVDVVRFAIVNERESTGPVILWIGVTPASLSGEDAHAVALSCLDVLKTYNITDVDVEFRESVYRRSAGPSLLGADSILSRIAPFRVPVSPLVGLSIAAGVTPHTEGTGGIYFSEGGDSDKVFLLTARHVVLPPNGGANINYSGPGTNGPRQMILLLGPKAFDTFIKSMKAEIARDTFMAEHYRGQLKRLEEEPCDEDDMVEKRIKEIQRSLNSTTERIEELKTFHDEVKKDWTRIGHRVLGHIINSPPITLGAGAEGFTEDYAIIELDRAKLGDAFKGNAISIGTCFRATSFLESPRIPFFQRQNFVQGSSQ